MHLNKSIQDPILRVTQFLGALTVGGKIPGIQYVVVDAQRVILNYAGGFADIKNDVGMRPETTMPAYSMTKTFTAIAVLQLVSAGKIDLDDTVEKHLPGVPHGNRMTIRQLLIHTSGLPNPIPLKWVHAPEKHTEFDEVRELTKVLDNFCRRIKSPGKRYRYSNIGYWLLGQIIEAKTNLAFPRYLALHVFGKLGLQQNMPAFTIQNPAGHAKGYLQQYSFFNLVKKFLIDAALIGEVENHWLHIHNHYLNGQAFGGLFGAAQDFAVFLQDQLQPHSLLFDDRTRAFLYTPQYRNNRPIPMTLGWHIGNLDGITCYFKEGGGGGYHSEMRLYPAKGFGTVIMVNATIFNSKKTLNALDKAFLVKL